MPEADLILYGKGYEYDIYTLVKAFFPGKNINLRFENEKYEGEDAFMRLCLKLSDGRAVFTVSDGEKTVERSDTVADETDRKSTKNTLKRLTYNALREYTGIDLPWGDLTGIRPIRIPSLLLEQGMRPADIERSMQDNYFVSEKKASLATHIAVRERSMLAPVELKKSYSLYVGIPFCPSICLYCSFGSHPLDRFGDLVEPYLEALYKELDYISEAMEGRELTSIYIGGGTPTTLTASQLDALLTHIEDKFPMEDIKEFTVEAGRPDTIDEDKLYTLLAHPVSRISVNPQTMNDKTLETIGRRHTSADTVKAFTLAREAGFENINMDIIVGLPGEGEEEVRYTLDRIKELDPDSLTVHSLALKRSTRLNLYKDEYAPVSFDNSEEIMDMSDRYAHEMLMRPYYLYRQKNMAGNFENIGYGRKDCLGLYNVLIMEEKQTIMAAGSGAISKFVYSDGRIERAANVKDLKNYIERTDEMIARKDEALKKYIEEGE